MNRSYRTALLVAAIAAVVGGAAMGCNFIVGVGDYSVGSGTPSGEGGAVMGGEDGGSEGGASDAKADGPAVDARVNRGLVGDPCMTNTDCTAAGANCNGTSCVESCTTSASCGSNSAGTPNVCVQGLCFPGCTTNAGCAPYDGTTCQLLVAGSGEVCAPGSTTTGTGTIGDPCTSQADCAKGQCNGTWCAEACVPATGCGSNTAGNQNQCLPAAGSSDICFPGCAMDSDCAVFTGTLTCQVIGSVSACKATSGNIGDPCTTSAQCTQGSCMSGIPWCTTSCSSTGATCGSTSVGESNYCVENANSAYICFAGCTMFRDCTAYPGTTCQLITGSSTQYVCSSSSSSTNFGFIGDPCATATDCTEGTCMAPDIVWCTQACTVDSDCQGSDSAGNPTYCVLNGAGNHVCFPGCTTDADCTGYSVSLTCQANASEAGTKICSQ